MGYVSNRGPTFNVNAVEQFLEDNNLEYIVRGHQCVKGGFEKSLKDKVVTIFSAPNYGGGNNKASVMSVNNQEIRFLQFSKGDAGIISMDNLCFKKDDY